jgi:hypothetical protein
VLYRMIFGMPILPSSTSHPAPDLHNADWTTLHACSLAFSSTSRRTGFILLCDVFSASANKAWSNHVHGTNTPPFTSAV